jgi:tRNA G18 (ribose-2'-O)-methylase SpoU
MFHFQHIESLDLPELAPYRTMKRPVEHQAQGIFIAEGEKVVRRLLESRFTVVSALLPEKWVAEFEPLLQARPEDIPVYVVQKKQVLEKLVGFSMFQGVMAVGKIPTPALLDAVLARSAKPRLLVAVDALTNAENLGVLVRNCVAFGVQALLVGETCASPYLRRAVRNSMGTIFQLPVVELGRAGSPLPAASPKSGIPQSGRVTRPTNEPENLSHVLIDLRARGIRCVAAHPSATGKTLSQADFSADCCLVFGSEGYGISAPVLAACDEAVAIPMATGVDSLNVSVAAAVFLYEVNRQRNRA